MLIQSPPAIVRTDSQYQEHQRRTIAKIELLKTYPYCSGCGNPVVARAGRENSASLVIDALACPRCVDKVRKVRIGVRAGGHRRERVSSTSRRAILKEKLLALNAKCSGCKRAVKLHVDTTLPDHAHLIIDRLSCRDCRSTVRATVRAENEILKSQRII